MTLSRIRRPFAAVVAIAIVILLSTVGVLGFLFSPSTITKTETVTSEELVISGCNTTMIVNGSDYCSTNVTSYIELGNPGYSYFIKNIAAIDFLGVKFELICPPIYYGCPGYDNSGTLVETVFAGSIKVQLTFADNSTETLSSILQNGGTQSVTLLSNHASPKAGMIIEYQPSAMNYESFLLVTNQTGAAI